MPEPPDGIRYELVRGELRIMPGPKPVHGRMVAWLTFLIEGHADANDLGQLFTGDAGFWLERDPDTVRGPDLAFIVKARALRPIPPGYGEVSPDLMVEVRSPSNSARDIAERIEDFRRAGTRVFWVVDPAKRTVVVHEGQAPPRELGVGDVLEGGEVLPGFAVTVARVFSKLD